MAIESKKIEGRENVIRSADETNGIKIIDHQWAGRPSDPAEAFVRMGKWKSTTMMQQNPQMHIRSSPNAIHIDVLTEPFVAGVSLLQEYALSRIPDFEDAFDDLFFKDRVNGYFCGSYLRELGLSSLPNRGGPEAGIVALIKTAEHAQLLL